MPNPSDTKIADILIVDDTFSNQDLLSSMLKRYGYTARVADNGYSALEIIRQQPPDLILLDVMLPDMDGYAVCKTLKDDDRLRDIPVIFISALNDTEHIIRAFRAGGVDYITKPFKHPEVIARVNMHLEMKFLREQDKRLIDQLSDEIQRRKYAEQEAVELALERERKLILSQFFQNAYHEFKTPLSVIGTNLYLLEHSVEDPVVVDRLKKIEEQADMLRDLVEAMVTMTVLDSDPDLNIRPVDLRQVVRSVVINLQSMAAINKVSLHVEEAATECIVLGDPQRLDTALRNIVNNALRYTPAGGQIDVRTFSADKEIGVMIEDTGIGMTPQQRARIFDRFYRADEARSTRGFGLGLSIARSIIELHHGHVDVESAVQQGSRFTVTFPRPA
jgi:two-component system sensor histidine kinase/response regulator